MEMQYLNTRDLRKRYRCCSRTIFRKMKRDKNPMPMPIIRNQGACNLWLFEAIVEWDVSEVRRSKESNTNISTH